MYAPIGPLCNIQAFVLTDTLFVILTIPLLDKSLIFYLYRIHDIQLLHPILKKSFQYEKEHRIFAIRSDLCSITFPDENVLNCAVLSGHFCGLDNALHIVNKIQEGNYILFQDDKEIISKDFQILILNQTRDFNFKPNQRSSHYNR